MKSELLWILMIILPIGIIAFIIIKKKKSSGAPKKQRKEERDEVWATIKRHLKEQEEYGKEIIDAFTAKRPNPYDTSAMTKEQRAAYKLHQKEMNDLKKTDPEAYKKQKLKEDYEKRKKPKDLYVVLFTTRDTKTLVVDPPRALECEVIMKKIDKSKTERIIQINGEKDYDVENAWIKPIRDKEDKAYRKQLERMKKKNKKEEKTFDNNETN